MQIYMVGGAVRDALLGLPVKDRDWVAVGATPQQLVDLGYMPVGKDFHAFLHPITKDEVALARQERKTAPGYHGFAFHAAPVCMRFNTYARCRCPPMLQITLPVLPHCQACKSGFKKLCWKKILR